jgi:hypothetical protein
MKRVFKNLKERQEQLEDQRMQMEQQKLEQQQQIAAAQMEQQMALEQGRVANENYNKEMDRINKKEIAIISATGYGNVASEDTNQNAVPDVLEVSKFASEEARAQREYQMKMSEAQSKQNMELQKLQVEREKLQVERENMANDLQIAKENAKGRNQKKNEKK